MRDSPGRRRLHRGRQPSGAIFFGICMLVHSCRSSISSDRCSEDIRAPMQELASANHPQ
jgi:hypothetical protein